MPSPLIGEEQYPAVRALVGATPDTLPDATLELSVFVPAGIADVLRYVPDAEARTDPDEVTHLQNAAVYFAAARVGPTLPEYASEGWDDYRYARPVVDWTARVAWLQGAAMGEIGIVEPGAVPVPAPAFALASSAYTLAAGRADWRGLPGVSAGGPAGRGSVGAIVFGTPVAAPPPEA